MEEDAEVVEEAAEAVLLGAIGDALGGADLTIFVEGDVVVAAEGLVFEDAADVCPGFWERIADVG